MGAEMEGRGASLLLLLQRVLGMGGRVNEVVEDWWARVGFFAAREEGSDGSEGEGRGFKVVFVGQSGRSRGCCSYQHL